MSDVRRQERDLSAMADEIPIAAECETLHQWTMRHPTPHLMEIEFAVPTPTRRQLTWGKWFWRILLLAWVLAACLLALPRLDVLLLFLAVPIITIVCVINAPPRVQKLSIDSKDRTICVTDLRAGKSTQRIIPFLEVMDIRYVPDLYHAGRVTPAAIWIDVDPPYEGIRLVTLGVTQHEQLEGWLRTMIQLHSDA